MCGAAPKCRQEGLTIPCSHTKQLVVAICSGSSAPPQTTKRRGPPKPFVKALNTILSSSGAAWKLQNAGMSLEPRTTHVSELQCNEIYLRMHLHRGRPWLENQRAFTINLSACATGKVVGIGTWQKTHKRTAQRVTCVIAEGSRSGRCGRLNPSTLGPIHRAHLLDLVRQAEQQLGDGTLARYHAGDAGLDALQHTRHRDEQRRAQGRHVVHDLFTLPCGMATRIVSLRLHCRACFQTFFNSSVTCI